MKKEPDGISIHAPPRGATRTISEGRMLEVISIHAPPRGATLIRLSVLPRRKVFQFTPLREGRRRDRGGCRRPGDFNSRPSARGDKVSFAQPNKREFQFTPLREGRLFPMTLTEVPILFQFTPLREGRLPRASRCAQAAPISIHAPPRGATVARFFVCLRHPYFNSRPSARGDGGFLVQGRIHLLFQFTPLREGRRRPRCFRPRR